MKYTQLHPLDKGQKSNFQGKEHSTFLSPNRQKYYANSPSSSTKAAEIFILYSVKS
jgi:hypothetical protein